MNTELALLSADEVAGGVRGRRFSATEVTQATLARIEAINPRINAFTTLTPERALREARAVDDAVAAGRDPGPLAGAGYSVKNLFDLQGVTTVAGSRISRDDPPATRDATSVQRLKAAGAICLGATNMGEYAYDFVTINAHYGATRNPRDLGRSAGGSSGGSGASVAAGLGALSLGSDTNGSVRVPASFCGIWGLKPTYGRLSRAGTFLFAGSLDTVGVFGRRVRDLALSLDAMAGPDARDPVCAPDWPTSSVATLEQGIQGLRFAHLGGYFARGWSPEVTAAMYAIVASLGADDCIDLPEPALARSAAYMITAAEGGELHRSRLATRAAEFDPAARDRFIAGALVPAAWLLQAQRFRAWWQAQLREVFQRADVLIAPATPMVAPQLDQQTFEHEGVQLPLRPNIGLFTQPITLVGLPVVAAPLHHAGGLPIAVQLIGRPGSESILLRIARELELRGVCSAPLAPLE
jgi:1-carboxybiuret hydrolase